MQKAFFDTFRKSKEFSGQAISQILRDIVILKKGGGAGRGQWGLRNQPFITFVYILMWFLDSINNSIECVHSSLLLSSLEMKKGISKCEYVSMFINICTNKTNYIVDLDFISQLIFIFRYWINCCFKKWKIINFKFHMFITLKKYMYLPVFINCIIKLSVFSI